MHIIESLITTKEDMMKELTQKEIEGIRKNPDKAKSLVVTKLLDIVSLVEFNRTRGESLENQVCVACGGRAFQFDDKLSEKEYSISGLCQACQDETFEEEEDDD